MPAPLDLQFLRADLAQARQMLRDGRAYGDAMAEHQYAQRVAQLERKLAESSRTPSTAQGNASKRGPSKTALEC